jgi:hypothetical protein
MNILHSHRILHQPLVDGFGWMGHEDATFEVGFGHYIRQRCSMVEMEAMWHVSMSLLEALACKVQARVAGEVKG